MTIGCDQVKELHEAASDACLLWKHSGKPRQGVVCDIMKQSRSRVRNDLRVCKTNNNSTIVDKIAEKMCEKNDIAFWREIKHSLTSKIKLPNVVGNAEGNDNISVVWQEHYSYIFNAEGNDNISVVWQEHYSHIFNAEGNDNISVVWQEHYSHIFNAEGNDNISVVWQEHYSHIFNAEGNDNISVVWQEHYSHIFNMVSGSNCKELHTHLCRHHSVLDPNMIVTSNEIEEIITDLSYC